MPSVGEDDKKLAMPALLVMLWHGMVFVEIPKNKSQTP